MSINKPRKVTDNFEQSSIVPKEVKVKKKIAVQISPDSSKFVTKRYFKESYCRG